MERIDGQPPKVLLIEDDLFLSEMYQHVFEKDGWIFTKAEDGEEGTIKACAEEHDLILLDIMMPKRSGIEVLKLLRQPDCAAKDTPIILLSNLGQESVIKEAFEMGADGYLLKADLLPRQVLEKATAFLEGKLTKADFLPAKSSD